MRWVHLIVIVLFAAAVVTFAAQNSELVTMSFLGFSASMRLALLIGIVYLLGMATGGSLLSLLGRSWQGARRQAA